MSDAEWTVAVGRSPRTAPLLDGLVRAPGLRFTPGVFSDIFRHMLWEGAYHASEMSFSYQLIAQDQGEAPLVALPAFPHRYFRQADIYVRADSPLRGPEELGGKRFAVQDFFSADPLWIRGFLREQYGVDTRSIHWVQYRFERRLRQMPAVDFDIQTAENADPEELLRSGAVDAAFIGTSPAFAAGASWIRRLVPDVDAAERAFYQQFGVMPILHTLVVRAPCHAAAPERSTGLYHALCHARDHWYAALRNGAVGGGQALTMATTLAEVTDLLGADFWPYGVEENRKAIDLGLRWAHADGLIARAPTAEETFLSIPPAA